MAFSKYAASGDRSAPVNPLKCHAAVTRGEKDAPPEQCSKKPRAGLKYCGQHEKARRQQQLKIQSS